MQSMIRNRKEFWYALYDHEEEVFEDGYRVGVKSVYQNPVQAFGNVAYELSQTYTEMMTGVAKNYQMFLSPMPVDCPIDEQSILWIDTMPEIKDDGSTDTPHDYIVIRKAKSLNMVRYRIHAANSGSAYE